MRHEHALKPMHHSFCYQMRNNEQALGSLIYNAAAVPALAALLAPAKQPVVAVREAAAQVLALLCSTRPEAITQAVTAGCVPSLSQLLTSTPAQLCSTAAASALLSITKAKEGKLAFLEVCGWATKPEWAYMGSFQILCCAITCSSYHASYDYPERPNTTARSPLNSVVVCRQSHGCFNAQHPKKRQQRSTCCRSSQTWQNFQHAGSSWLRAGRVTLCSSFPDAAEVPAKARRRVSRVPPMTACGN